MKKELIYEGNFKNYFFASQATYEKVKFWSEEDFEKEVKALESHHKQAEKNGNITLKTEANLTLWKFYSFRAKRSEERAKAKEEKEKLEARIDELKRIIG